MATYPFFREVAGTAGRLLALQGSASGSQIQRRITERWGARSTVVRAFQRVARSLLDWGALRETDAPGTYAAGDRLCLGQDEAVSLWLLESLMSSSDSEVAPLAGLVNDPALFPFRLTIPLRAFANHRNLQVHALGTEGALVEIRKDRPL